METVDLIACVFGVDGDELYGCTDDVIMGQHLSFWNIYGRDTFTLYRLKDVPILTAEKLVDHGADFHHQGGYQFPSDVEAWETAESHVTEKIEEYSFGDEAEEDSENLIDQASLKVGMIQKHQPSMSRQNHDLRPSLVRVADRYMLPPEVYEYESRIRTARSLDDAPFIEAQEDYERKLDAFDQSIEDFLDLVERAIEKQNGRKPNRGIVRETASDKSWMKGPMGRVMRNKFSHSWVPLANAGVKLMDLGMDRKIPKSKARKFTAFSRLWGSARSVPRNILTWQERHHRTLDFGREMILNSEGDWTLSTSSESETSGGQTFRVGKFTVHNINSLEGKRLDEFKTIINKAAKVIPSAKIPGFAKALYGDIYLVGSIRGSRTQAWYDSSKDLVYLRTDKRVQSDPLHSLIHELAHRYWRKFADADAKKVWGQRHFDMSRGQPDMTGHWPVKAGMRLPFAVKWQMAKRKYVKSNPGEPVVTRVRGAMVELDIPKVGLREVGLDWYRKGLRQHLHQSSFPSAYASTDPEEHFCEAAGYRALNQLSKDHKEALDRIFGR